MQSHNLGKFCEYNRIFYIYLHFLFKFCKMIQRKLSKIIESDLFKRKAIILFGARQTGKTTLLKAIFSDYNQVLWLSGDESDTQGIFEQPTSTRLKHLFANKKIVIIDEAQRIEDIGIKLKLITDHIPEIQIVATGSSSFELANKVNEPLTGRKWEHQLYPISFEEMVNHHGLLEEKRLVKHRLIYGCYPEVITNAGNEKRILSHSADSYLYKDILQWEYIKKSDKLLKLLKAIAFQLGNQVSFNELGRLIGIDNETVEKYILLLEQTFIIFRLPSLNRNLRTELKKSRKIYFHDNGIRNALINDFRLTEERNDIGSLWENYMISERYKHMRYSAWWTNSYFWRTHHQQEIDYVEERNGQFNAYEFKWNSIKKIKLPESFAKAYPNHTFKVITPDNFEDFILNEETI